MTGELLKQTGIIFFILASAVGCRDVDKDEKIKVDVEKARILSQPSFDEAVKRSLEDSSAKTNKED
jgi:hypothetical protein